MSVHVQDDLLVSATNAIIERCKSRVRLFFEIGKMKEVQFSNYDPIKHTSDGGTIEEV